eukprot:TRINITY_DN1435_c0_g1_i1.p1 TRINITY_DN1435_c0_g1~~TRINITY_DN1435_c0_g1_i1.p1  ORF type:complete len:687 (-),score=135.01 TRINITY_DN1435_c0_g1_i1:122-2182(-)
MGSMRIFSLVFVLIGLFAVYPALSQDLPVSVECALAFKSQTALETFFMFDAWAKSIEDLGKFDQCNDMEGIAHYCLLRFDVPGMDSLGLSEMGTCIPQACNETDMKNLFMHYESEVPLILELAEENGKINATQAKIIQAAINQFMAAQNHTAQYICHKPTRIPKGEMGFPVMITVCVILTLFCIVGTVLDGLASNWWPEVKKQEFTDNPVHYVVENTKSLDDGGDPSLRQSLIERNSQPPANPAFVVRFFLAFSVVKNWEALWSTGKTFPTSCLNGLRVFSIWWVMLSHSLDYQNYVGVSNAIHVLTKDIQRFTAQAFPGAEFAVDTFFWLSGFLVGWLTLKEMRKGMKVGSWIMYVVHRIWRLTPTYYFILFFYIYISPYWADGAVWYQYQETVKETCGRYWWANVLYINNFIPSLWNSQCMLWSWYLANDFQFYLATPFILIAYHKNKTVGWIFVILLTIGTLVANGLLAHEHHFLWNSANSNGYMDLAYGKPYTRAAPYLIGLCVSFLYIEEYRLKRVLAWILMLTGAVLMSAVVYGPVSQFRSASELHPPVSTWSQTDSWMYFTFSKFGWSLGVALLMYPFIKGYGGFVRRFLAAPFWDPLARLTYSAYLIHPMLMLSIYYSTGQFYDYTDTNFPVYFVGEMVMAFCMAVVVYLVLERPSVNLEKVLTSSLAPRKPRKPVIN